MPLRVGGTTFVGRQHELDALLDSLDAARKGLGSVTLIAGEPGAGKTRLLRELADRAGASGWSVLSGRAYESAGMPAYLPFVEALTGYIRACSPAVLAEQLGSDPAQIALLLPEVHDRVGSDSAVDLRTSSAVSWERYRLFESVCDFLLTVAGVGCRGSGVGRATEGSGPVVARAPGSNRVWRRDRCPQAAPRREWLARSAIERTVRYSLNPPPRRRPRHPIPDTRHPQR